MVMVLMALDHANHFVAQKHPSGEIWDGAYPIYYDAWTFLTRFVTHFAAPGFFLLMGVGMYLFARSRREKGWGRLEVMRHFWLRGLVLIALQIVVVNRAWELSPGGWGIDLYWGVLTALGANMILGSLLVWLPPAALAALAAGLFVGIEFLQPGLGMWGAVQHDPANVILLRPGGTQTVYSFYPVLAWTELAVFGMFLGHWMAKDPKQAFGRAWKLGLVFLAGFAAIRFIGGFGNIRPKMSDGWIDFLNPVKYPPSMAFTLMTTGVNLIFLWLFSLAGRRVRFFLQPLAVLGRAPLFFYVLHLFLYAGMGTLFAPEGTSIGMLYPYWLLGLLVLFPLTWLFGRYKHSRPANSLVRLL
jgi:uncharacterized membrane protein